MLFYLTVIYAERSRGSLIDFGDISDLENFNDDAHPATKAWTRLPSISRLIDAQDMRRKRRHQFRTSASLDNCKWASRRGGFNFFPYLCSLRNFQILLHYVCFD